MRAIVVVVRDVLAEQAQQMTVVEDDDMVEELAVDAADPAFRDAVLPRAPWGGDAIGNLGTTGNKNTVSWKKALSGDKPGTRNTGKDNKNTQSK